MIKWIKSKKDQLVALVKEALMTDEDKARASFQAAKFDEEKVEKLLIVSKVVADKNNIPLDLAADFVAEYHVDAVLAYKKNKSQARNWDKWRKVTR